MAFSYMSGLTSESLARYKHKIALVGLYDCPYQFPADVWVDNPKEWPSLHYYDLYQYLIQSRLHSPEAMKNYRSLESYKWFIEEFVGTVLYFKSGRNTILKADVKPSQRVNQDPHHPWVALGRDADVIGAHCDCMSGRGESCSHVAALLFKIEAAVRLGYAASACVEEACFRGVLKKVEPAMVSDKHFCHEDVKQKRSCNTTMTTDHLTPLSEGEENNCWFALAEANSHAVGLVASTAHSQRFECAPAFRPQQLPSPLWTLHTSQDLNISVTLEEVSLVEVMTRQQSNSSIWYEQRVGRLTSSTAHTALKADVKRPPQSLISKVCEPMRNTIRTPAILWGKEHESEAFSMYTANMIPHAECSTKTVGLLISIKTPHLAASPDGLVNCLCCGNGIIEIKCPYKHRNNTIAIAVQDDKFCLDKNMCLKEDHPYYTQVQLQMYVAETMYGDFIVWTTKELSVQRIARNEDFIQSMVGKLTEFWERVILPKLLTRSIEKGVPDETQATTSGVFCV